MKIKIILTLIILLCGLKSFGQQITSGLVSAYYFTGGSLQQANSSNVAVADPDVTVTPYGASSSFTFSRTPQSIEDRFGNANNALDFDAITIPEADGMGFPVDRSYATTLVIAPANLESETYTYSLWYKIVDGSAASVQYLLSIGNNGGDQTVNLSGSSMRAHSYYHDPYDGGSSLVFPIATVSSGFLSGWNHFVSVRSGDSLKCFVNGTLMDKLKIVPTHSGGPEPFYGFNPAMAVLGARYNKSSAFTGYMDDVRLFNRALSDAEVVQEYNFSSASEYDEDLVAGIFNAPAKNRNFSVYPNPASDKFEIMGDESHAYELFSPGGTILKRGKTDVPVEVGDLESGIYFIRIDNRVEKVIIR